MHMCMSDCLAGRLSAVHPDVDSVNARSAADLGSYLPHKFKQLLPLGRAERFDPPDMSPRHHKHVTLGGGIPVREGDRPRLTFNLPGPLAKRAI